MDSIQIKTYQTVFGVLALSTLSNPWVLSGVAAQDDGSGDDGGFDGSTDDGGSDNGDGTTDDGGDGSTDDSGSTDDPTTTSSTDDGSIETPTTTQDIQTTPTEDPVPTSTDDGSDDTWNATPDPTESTNSLGSDVTSSSAAITPTIGSNNNGGSSGLSGGAIAGVVVGVIAGVAIIAGAAVFLFIRRKRATHDDDREVYRPEDDSDNVDYNTNTISTVQTPSSYQPMTSAAPPPPRHTYNGPTDY